LTAGASGDDFSLVRLVISPLALSGEELPLDDPNSDFVEAKDPVLPRQNGNGSVELYAKNTTSPLGGCCAPLGLGHAISACFPCAERSTPLRC
jgi:hypothetical protein